MRRIFSITLVVLGCGAIPSADDTPSLKTVMRRAAAYVDAYGQRASIVVATERYTQRLTTDRSDTTTERSLVSEFAIVRVEANRAWIGFRDVIEVDGRRLGDRQDRLIEVLTTSSGGLDEARQISDESSRFNIGSIERNFNVPTASLFFFTPDRLERFKFALKDRRPGAWQVGFRETGKPTLIRTLDGMSVASEGSLWVDPVEGTIVRTKLHVREFGDKHSEPQHGSADIEVSYRLVRELGMWLPATMSEAYEAVERSGAWNRITGRAEYSNYRRFETSARIK